MFGLMKIATHQMIVDAIQKRRFEEEFTRDRLQDERDEAKTRETTAKAENVTLKARIAELENLVVWQKGKAEPVKSVVKLQSRKPVNVAGTVKVPVKGKVKS